MPETKGDNILEVKKSEQYKTIDELILKSRPNTVYYTLLILSAFIISSGLLLGSAAVVIGGMLVTPMLTPMLVVGLGLSTGELKIVKREGALVVKSSFLVVTSSLLLALLFGKVEGPFFFDDTLRTAVLYFVVAIASGAAATFAWVRKEASDALPGIAIAVSLVPPLGMVGIGLSTLDMELIRAHIFIFIFNLLGVVMGSLVVFSLLKFYKAGKEVEKKNKEIEKEEKGKKR